MRESDDYVLRPALVHFEEFTIIDDTSDDTVLVVCLVGIVWNDVVEIV